MAATGAGLFSCFSPLRHCRGIRAQLQPKAKASVTAAESTPATVLQSSTTSTNGIGDSLNHNGRSQATPVGKKKYDDDSVAKSEGPSFGLKDYYEQSIAMMKSNDGGPPRWFSPLESGGGARSTDSPLLLFLPGLDGVGLGLMLHHQRLGEIFDLWCLHIPITDRTPFTELVKLIERTIRSENHHLPSRPIYLVGESLGGCLALAVAARNPDIDLMLILANPATCFSKSQLQPILSFLEMMPKKLHFGMPYLLSLLTVYALNAFKEAIYEDPLLAMSNWNVLDADPCDWCGISCSIARDHILQLNITGSALKGFLAPELGLLSALQELILHGNNLIGAIPKELGNLNYLQVLDLGMNQLVGPIPPELGNCSSLMTINLESNGLTGEVPPELGNLNYLEELKLDRNKFQGTVPGNNNSDTNSSIYGKFL